MSQKGLGEEPEDLIAQVLRFESYLAERKDAACYTVEQMQDAQGT